MKKKLLIIIIMITALVLSYLSTKTIFLGATPKINPAFIVGLINIPGNIAQNVSRPTIPKLSDSAPLKQLSPGVYAGERNDIQVFEYRESEIDYVKVTITTVSGKTYTINYPKQYQPSIKELNYLKNQ
ncbi:hypothetical protein CO083_01205 [Candidatus Roizmanbacteria bacterium CG_4_9_14_0_8_um_filter_34_12]|uniref:Uncharacterized protein n=1 Tax=Candidatus Roizmanbacteria bacterium CG_4_9_14_0_8_um_filter_34_12 TaxID=1974840 RepID=A0A2M8DDX8_9BACT|nr:MAG: hypothetical protein CO083_01205 [Candidatus Roizmanbacteria bacterium CG_4_9_14_0_8_um_filter_34_12]